MRAAPAPPLAGFVAQQRHAKGRASPRDRHARERRAADLAMRRRCRRASARRLRVRLAGAEGRQSGRHSHVCSSRPRRLGDGLAAKTECARDLGDGQALTIPAVVDPGVRLVVDHDRLRGQGGGARGPRDMARMSWPRRNKRSAVRTMSSCCGVPTRWAIKPIRTAGCAIMRSCSGDRTKKAVLPIEPIGCVVETSLGAPPARWDLRQ